MQHDWLVFVSWPFLFILSNQHQIILHCNNSCYRIIHGIFLYIMKEKIEGYQFQEWITVFIVLGCNLQKWNIEIKKKKKEDNEKSWKSDLGFHLNRRKNDCIFTKDISFNIHKCYKSIVLTSILIEISFSFKSILTA